MTFDFPNGLSFSIFLPFKLKHTWFLNCRDPMKGKPEVSN